MASMFNKKPEVFDLKFQGSFGRFATGGSHPAYYILTSIPVRKLKDSLQVAADALPISKISFSQMIQRDVNVNHVSEIKKYILEGSGKAVFFPPLLVSIIALDSQGSVQENLDTPPQRLPDDESTASVVWDKDLFKLTFYKTEDTPVRSRLEGFGTAFSFHDFGVHMDLNSLRAKLVVIDGQHRYKALTQLYDAAAYRSSVEQIEVPICMVFSPFATVQGYSGLQDLREIFVTVNNQGKKVSGHFLELLRDFSNASDAVRELAGLWKEDSSTGYSLLHHLEWNTHDEKRAGQLNRPYSFTTITVLSEVLRKSLFVKNVAATMLQLPTIHQQLLDIDPDFDIDEVGDTTSGNGLQKLIAAQIHEHVARPLALVFTQFAPYQWTAREFGGRMQKLAQDKATGKLPERGILFDLFEKHQIPSDPADITSDAVRLAYLEFVKGVNERQIAEAPHSRLAVFQQALVRSWILLSKELIKNDVLPLESATMLVAAFNKTLLPQGMHFLSNGSTFTQRMLWSGETVNFRNETARTAWVDLMVSTLMMKSAQDSALKALEQIRGKPLDSDEKALIVESFKSLAASRLTAYLAELADAWERFYRGNYAELISDEAQVEHLRSLQNSTKQSEKQEFAAAIQKLAGKRYEEASSKLKAHLGVTKS